MEKYVIPPIFNLDFKFPASLLLLQLLRQFQKASMSQRLSQPAATPRHAALRGTNGKYLSQHAGRPTTRRAGCREY